MADSTSAPEEGDYLAGCPSQRGGRGTPARVRGWLAVAGSSKGTILRNKAKLDESVNSAFEKAVINSATSDGRSSAAA
jgi:hypothetical protein